MQIFEHPSHLHFELERDELPNFHKMLLSYKNKLNFRVINCKRRIGLLFEDCMVAVPLKIDKYIEYYEDKYIFFTGKVWFPFEFHYDKDKKFVSFKILYKLSEFSFSEHILISLFADRSVNNVFKNGNLYSFDTVTGYNFKFLIGKKVLEDFVLKYVVSIPCEVSPV